MERQTTVGKGFLLYTSGTKSSLDSFFGLSSKGSLLYTSLTAIGDKIVVVPSEEVIA